MKEQLTKQNPFRPSPDGQKLSGPIKLGIINKNNGFPISFGAFPETFTMHGLTAGRTGVGRNWRNIPLLESLVNQSPMSGYNLVAPSVKLSIGFQMRF